MVGERIRLNSKIIITIPVTALAATMIILGVVQMQQAQAAFESQAKDFGQGREDGVTAGAAAYNPGIRDGIPRDGIPRDSGSCPAGHSASYCIGYGSGWVRGWDDAKDLGR